ncbi:hypothetical protein FSP39_014136 [Pinctada imbricata]|uniref:AAA+ ATPase domain-containing protein n=1 Tax=Pinctada imbricata TaxID=66713 RepID=A0AA89BPN1_PINIB|nr:hypothetical protein FSP39_014136 [Pinctada imbricata]
MIFSAPQKLAPIFMKRGKKEEPVTPVKKVLDPEAEKRRRAFLMSDVPDELRRQAASVIMIADADYPPIPKINHVQQIGISDVLGGKDLWKLPEVILNYRKDLKEGGWKMQSGTWGDNLITKTESTVDYTKIKTFTSHPKISESSIDLILSEIGRLNPVYPVKKMYSILREKKEDDLEEEVTEKNNKKASKPDDEDTKPKSRPRRSLRLRPVIEVIDVIGSPEKVNDTEEAQAEKQDSVPPTLVFTERYQPLNTSEVVGNTALLKKLKAWLVEWKHRVDKEARKARMLLMKKSKGKRPKEEEDSGDWWADDASDFDMSSDDSEDEDSLCNTVMLTGPTGIGKTATVYALAQELGFKVFEVNASSCRNGKRILAQLQEATQSHQVSKNSVGGSNTPVKIDKKKEPGVDQKKKLPTAFTNLFKQAESQSKKDVPSKKAPKKEDGDSRKKKRKREEEEEEMSKSSKKKKKDQEKSVKKSAETEKVSGEVDSGKSLSLSSTSLILFDEVDIVFEQDKAFWAAVQSFMSTTKIPIILTSNDSKLHTKFEGRFEHYAFKIPSMVTSTIYLQLVCLVENIRDLPPVHLSCVNTMMGCGLGGDQDFLKRLTTMAQEKESGWLPTAVEACLQYHCLKTDIIYNQHLELLSLPKQTVDSSLLTKTRCMQKEVQKPKRRRIKLSCDLYDSEGSGDEDCDKKDTVTKKESNIVDENVTPKESSKNMKEEVKSLSSLYKFYDTLAFTDVMRQVHEKSDLYGVSVWERRF